MDKIFNLRIDTKNKNISEVQGFKQYDNNSILNITLLQNSLALDLSNCTVRLNFQREDKKILLYMADIVSAREGKVSIKLSPEVLEKTGNIKADISVFDSNLLKITSATFNMKVDESIYSNDYYLNMKDFDIVQRMHIEEEKRIANENKRIESESARITDEKKRSNAEALRNEKENERISNEEKRVKAESKRNEDEHTRSEAENKRKECESNRIDQEKIRIENEKTRVEGEDKRKISENTRVDNELGRITYEAKRATNEKIRIQSELNRVENEKLRSETEYKRLEAEKIRVEKEAERINSESKRLKNEQLRQTNETSRVEEWNKIKNTFKDNAPGDMKSIIYDKNGNGKVDIAELAESVEWENVKNKPNFDEIGKVKSVNSKTGDVILKAKDITTENGTNLEELNSQYEDFTNEIGNIKDLKTTNKDNLVESVNELFTNVDNGKDSLYSAIIGKKVMPKSKDFKDLTDAITDIKLGQGNVQAGEVLVGKTFTNDSGVMQTGTMPNMGSKEIEPKIYSQELGKGYYEKVKLKGINDLDNDTMKEVVKTIAPKIKDDLPSIIQSVGVLPFRIWQWKGSHRFDSSQQSLVVPFKIKILLIKFNGSCSHDDGCVYQTYFSDDIFKTKIGNSFLFYPNNKIRSVTYIEPEEFNYNSERYSISEFKLLEDKQTIKFPNQNIGKTEIYALGW
ncbi:BppU family phage baseplate upper protein [Clostridium botulinum]|uniref:BppU family phage baseplate upper protein n=1 Tax=Clostridium botulinum TaxID=1491 RepID=UPI00069EC5F0|nr:BppU family phage baseplate upper protein [Clostridium botulinum]